MTVHVYSGTISGGGSGTITVTLGASETCSVVVYKRGSKTINSSIDIYRQLASTNWPVNDDGTTSLTTVSGDEVVTFICTTDTAVSGWTGLTQQVAPTTFGARRILSAMTTNAAGGTPEALYLVTSTTFKNTSAVTLVLR